MAINYTERELNQMREQAIRSAREMQQRAVPPGARQSGFGQAQRYGARTSPQDREKEERLNRLVEEVIREAADSDCDVTAPDIDDRFVPPDEIFAREELPAFTAHGSHPDRSRDNDAMFIMAIIIILLREKPDFMLILAMMYILM